MIHYHGTPVGGTEKDAIEFIQGRHCLVPFAYPEQLKFVMPYCQSFILDNSAFTYWKQGGQLDINAYLDWVKPISKHPAFDWCLIPDVIDGVEQDNKDLVMRWLQSGSKIRGVPVFHFHESLEWLEWLVDHCEMVALGSSGQWPTPGADIWWKRLSELMRVICDDDGKPKCKIHGLRMLDHKIFSYIPLHSADSTNAAVNSGDIRRFGMYVPPTRGQCAIVIANRIEQFQSSAVWINQQGEMNYEII